MIARGPGRSAVPMNTWQKVTDGTPRRARVAANSAEMMVSFMARLGQKGGPFVTNPTRIFGT